MAIISNYKLNMTTSKKTQKLQAIKEGVLIGFLAYFVGIYNDWGFIRTEIFLLVLGITYIGVVYVKDRNL